MLYNMIHFQNVYISVYINISWNVSPKRCKAGKLSNHVINEGDDARRFSIVKDSVFSVGDDFIQQTLYSNQNEMFGRILS